MGPDELEDKEDNLLVVQAVQRNGRALAFADVFTRADRSIVLLAVQTDARNRAQSKAEDATRSFW